MTADCLPKFVRRASVALVMLRPSLPSPVWAAALELNYRTEQHSPQPGQEHGPRNVGFICGGGQQHGRLGTCLQRKELLVSEIFCHTLLDLRDSLRLRGVRIFFIHCALFKPFMQLVGSLKPKFRPAELRSIFGTAHDVHAPDSAEEYRDILSEIDTAPFDRAGNDAIGDAAAYQMACTGTLNPELRSLGLVQ